VKRLHGFEDLVDPLPHLRPPAVDLSESGQVGVLLPHNIGAKASRERIQVASVERFDPLPDGLHVLPRHRLLRQPGGFEGGGPLGEDLTADQLSIAQRPQMSNPQLEVGIRTVGAIRSRMRATMNSSASRASSSA
jgi:hypothetical protein